MKITYNIYDENGYINIPWIAARPTWLKVIIGARQVGKTYGTLKYHLDNNKPFILLRRTTEELDFISSSAELDPFLPFVPEYRTRIIKQAKSCMIKDYDEAGKTIPESFRGMALSLPQISHIRGFNGSLYDSIVFDEFIPEKGVIVRKTEGDSLLNAYTTINGNRELQGLPPCTLWLLANTNNINSAILEALNLSNDIIRMRSRGLEYTEKNGVSIFQGTSARITEQRRQTALAQQINPDSDFARMAYANEWSYDKSPLVKPRSLKGMTPVCSYAGYMYIWEDQAGIYVCSAKHDAAPYKDDGFSTAQFTSDYAWLEPYYAGALITFSDELILARFKQLFNIDY